MSAIDIRRSHALDKEHARSAAESLAKDLSKQFDLTSQWDGDVLRFKRSGVKGQLTIDHSDLHMHLELGMLLRPFKSKIEQEIHSQLDELTKA